MQKIKYSAGWLFFSMLFLGACKKEKLLTFDTTNSIYFAQQDQYDYPVDSISFSFAYANEQVVDSVVLLTIKATGAPADADRKVKVVVDESSTAKAGIDYEALPDYFVFPAGNVSETIGIKLLRAEGLKNETVDLVLKLETNEDFTTKLSTIPAEYTATEKETSFLHFKLVIGDILVEPEQWNPFSYGKFTPKKLLLICELGGVEPAWFLTYNTLSSAEQSLFIAKRNYMGVLLQRYLLQQQNAGTPVLYEDGTEMATDDYVW